MTKMSMLAEGQEDRLRRSTRGEMVEVAPGTYAPANPNVPVADYTVAQWKRKGDGTWTAVPFREPFVRLDRHLGALLGFPGRQYTTIRRLAVAGFVEMIQVAPQTFLLNLDSWFNHLRRCAEAEEFWRRDGKQFKAYKESIG